VQRGHVTDDVQQAVHPQKGGADHVQNLPQVSGRAPTGLSAPQGKTGRSRASCPGRCRQCDLRVGAEKSQELFVIGAHFLQAHDSVH